MSISKTLTASKISDVIKTASGTAYLKKDIMTGTKFAGNQRQTDVHFREGSKWMSITMNDRDVPPASLYALSTLPGASLLD